MEGSSPDCGIHVELSFPDEPEVGRIAGIVRRSGRRLVVSASGPGYWFDRRYVPFRGRRWLQYLLTPLAAPLGVLFSQRDLCWSGMETDTPCLHLRPLVPPDFWLNVHFRSHEEADQTASLVASLFGAPPGD